MTFPRPGSRKCPYYHGGADGVRRVTVSADGLAAVSTQARVAVAQSADLSAHGRGLVVMGTPGGVVPHTLTVENIGARTADGAVVVFYGDYAFITAGQYSNCTFDNGQPRSCTFDEQLAAGTEYQTSQPIPLKLREDTIAPGTQFMKFEWMTKADFALLRKQLDDQGIPDRFGQPGTVGRLGLMALPQGTADTAQTDTDRGNGFSYLDVNIAGDNDADFAGVGGTAGGFTGQIVPTTIGIRNLGPATRDISRTGGGATLDFKLPQGTSLAEMPAQDANPGNDSARVVLNPASGPTRPMS